MSSTATKTFWSKMDNIHVVLLGDGNGDPVPMAPIPREDDGAIWFITSADHDTYGASVPGTDAKIYVADMGGQLFGTVSGMLTASTDTEKLDDLWTPMAAAWFEKGRDDPNVRLMKFTPSQGEVWATDGTIKYLFETIKANVAETTPDTGEYHVIKF
ncbi:MAG TPA: pyridoxamine 5'-phosphate oxidase family protein [Marivita sp.]|nr:pyridoxamine 5'-phosphate oxidase family protein [Marivita sp.]